MTATQSVVKLASGDTVQVRAGLLTGIGPEGPIGPVGPQGEQGVQGVPGLPGQTNLFATFMSGPISGTLSVPDTNAWTSVPAPTYTRNDLMATPLSQAAFAFSSGGLYLVIARAHFDPIASVTMNHTRALRLVDSTEMAYETVREPAVTQTDGQDVVLTKFVNDPGTGTLYHFEVAQDDSNGAVNLSDLEVQVVLCGSGPAGTGVHELGSGIVAATTPLSGFAEGVTYAVVSGDSSMPAPNGMLQTCSIEGTGTQVFTSPPTSASANPLCWTRSWVSSATAWSAWSALNAGAQGLSTYTPVLSAPTALTGVTAVGSYVRMGKMVYYNAAVTMTTAVGGSGAAYTVSLPSTPSASMEQSLFMATMSGNWGNGTPLYGYHRVLPSTAAAQVLLGNTSNNGLAALTRTSLGGAANGSSIAISGWYFED